MFNCPRMWPWTSLQMKRILPNAIVMEERVSKNMAQFLKECFWTNGKLDTRKSLMGYFFLPFSLINPMKPFPKSDSDSFCQRTPLFSKNKTHQWPTHEGRQNIRNKSSTEQEGSERRPFLMFIVFHRDRCSRLTSGWSKTDFIMSDSPNNYNLTT